MDTDADALDFPSSGENFGEPTVGTPIPPSTPGDLEPADLSQITLPSTEVPASPSVIAESVKTELNDDRQPDQLVIPSSLTPPPSTQPPTNPKRTFASSQPQQADPFSPPATILRTLGHRVDSISYAPPSSSQVLSASTVELRAMLQTCITENQKLKMETAHHKLQYNLLSLQAEEEAKRAVVEHEMIRREVDAFRMAEHSREAKRELSLASEVVQNKYLQMKVLHEDAMDEMDALHHRLRSAKRVIQEFKEENDVLKENRQQLLTRIRENREHFHMLTSPGGMFHSIMTPKNSHSQTPQQYRPAQRHTSKASVHSHDQREDREHGWSALLQVVSQDNNSAPSTPITPNRPVPRQLGKHHRNAQSLSSLPSTPVNRVRTEHGGLLPSIDLVPQTEPPPQLRRHLPSLHFPSTPSPSKREPRRKSRESTISEGDNEELARQALQSVAASHAHSSHHYSQHDRSGQSTQEDDVGGSQASQAATELLRRDARQSFEVVGSRQALQPSPVSADKSSPKQTRLLSHLRGGGEKRRFSGEQGPPEEGEREYGSPNKRAKVGNQHKVGLGIQYER